MYQRALKCYEKVLGPDHMSAVDTVNNLGLLYSDQGKFVTQIIIGILRVAALLGNETFGQVSLQEKTNQSA